MPPEPIYKINNKIDTILCDIEGTTTSISFVKDTLFPYVKDNLRSYLTENYQSETCQHDIRLLIELVQQDKKITNDVPIIDENMDNKELVIETVVKNVLWQMSSDRKTQALKQLQGHIWKDAYEKGLVKGHVYDDVVPAFEEWITKGYKIYIYSSGSIEAQKLLFQFSEKGDLLKHLSGHFDISTSGLKMEAKSYQSILNALNKSGDNVLFLTDMVNEYNAAKQVNIDVCLLKREETTQDCSNDSNNFKWVNNFSQIIN